MGQDPDAIRQDIAQTRDDMGETVEAVGYKADVPSRAKEAVVDKADAAKSNDDNELSRWTSDGKPANAWIEYHFDRPVTLNEVELKLVGWRSRSYPRRQTCVDASPPHSAGAGAGILRS